MARFGARCSPTAAPQRIRNGARVTRFRGRVPTDQLRDAQPRKTAWQDRDEDGERHLPSHLAIRVGYWRCLCAEMSASMPTLSMSLQGKTQILPSSIWDIENVDVAWPIWPLRSN